MLSTVEEYDPNTDKWTQKADMPNPRSGMAAAEFRNKIYLIGGVSGMVGPFVKALKNMTQVVTNGHKKQIFLLPELHLQSVL